MKIIMEDVGITGLSRFLVTRQTSHQRLWLGIFWWFWRDPSFELNISKVLMWLFCPDLLVAWVLISRAHEVTSTEERTFLVVSVIHLVLTGLGNLSLLLKQRRLSMRRWMAEFLAVVALELTSVTMASARIVTLNALEFVPFGGEHLASFLFSSSMGISTIVMLFQTPELLAALYMPLGWSDYLQPASRRLVNLTRQVQLWLVELNAAQRQQHVDQRGRGGGGPRVVYGEDDAAAAAAGGRAQPRAGGGPPPIVLSWPPKLPTKGLPLTDRELEILSAIHPNLVCPVSHAVPMEPAVGASGATFDRASLLAAVKATGRDPVTNAPCSVADIKPNYALRTVIEDYIAAMRRRAALATAGTVAQAANSPHTAEERIAKHQEQSQSAVDEEKEKATPETKAASPTHPPLSSRRTRKRRDCANVEDMLVSNKRLRPLASRKRRAAALVE